MRHLVTMTITPIAGEKKKQKTQLLIKLLRISFDCIRPRHACTMVDGGNINIIMQHIITLCFIYYNILVVVVVVVVAFVDLDVVVGSRSNNK